MKISRTGSLNSSSVRKAGRAAGPAPAGFASHLDGPDGAEAAAGTAVGGSRAVGGVDALLSVQEMGEALERESRARQRAGDILDRLDELRHGLLMGVLSRRQIENLARLVRLKRDSIQDPRLIDILDQIELRAEIELAKYSTLD